MTHDKPANRPDQWPQAGQFPTSIRTEFSLYLGGIILLLMAVTGYIVTKQYVSSVTTGVVETLLAQARSYAASAGKHIISAESPDVLMLSNVCTKLASDNADIHWVGIADNQGRFLSHTDIKQVMSGQRLQPIMATTYPRSLRTGEKLSIVRDSLTITIPIIEQGVPLGTLVATSSTRQIAQARKTSIVTVSAITAIMILLGIPAVMIVFNRRLRPFGLIINSLKAVRLDEPTFDIPIKSRNEFGYLAETLRVMGAKLTVAQREQIEKERVDREMEIAREIQANILPREYPQATPFQFAGAYRSAREVGGDYYDFLPLDENLLGYLIADVSGKSLPGMLVMLLTRDIVKRLARPSLKPSQLLSAVNRELLPSIKKGMFVTMFYGILDRRTGDFTFASAGHNPLVKMGADDGVVRLIKTKGFPLGMAGSDTFDKRIEDGTLRLAPGDWLIQYTDGINEAQDADKREYGMERFLDAVQTLQNQNADELVRGVMERHEAFVGAAPQYDDITLLAMKWVGTAADRNDSVNRTRTNVVNA
ncbi:MAG: PP2C family protein-serine/threonine phosphatase [candidate division Zixibacteria bacterium]|nr:PP2C family protein-serine/threonine phosphatase [candidate division Zixibacteria bacterium]